MADGAVAHPPLIQHAALDVTTCHPPWPKCQSPGNKLTPNLSPRASTYPTGQHSHRSHAAPWLGIPNQFCPTEHLVSLGLCRRTPQGTVANAPTRAERRPRATAVLALAQELTSAKSCAILNVRQATSPQVRDGAAKRLGARHQDAVNGRWMRCG